MMVMPTERRERNVFLRLCDWGRVDIGNLQQVVRETQKYEYFKANVKKYCFKSFVLQSR